jgi:predicted PurR-regulated permease PerM
MTSGPARLVLLGVVAFYAVGLGLFILYQIRDIIVLAFIAWIIAAAMRPAVAWLSRRLPRALSIGVVYLLLLVGVAALMFLVVPPLASEVVHLAVQLPTAVDQVQSNVAILQGWLAQYGAPVDLGRYVQQGFALIGENIGTLLRVPVLAFQAVFGVFAVLVLSFYWLISRDRTVSWLVGFLPPHRAARARLLFDRAEEQMGGYVRGLAVLALTIGGVTFVGLLVLRVPFALALAVLAGMLELLPNIGPIISAVPAVILAYTVSPLLALATAGLYLLVQQLENYLLVPKVHEQSVGVAPLAILLAVLIGGTLAGIAGAVLAVPVAALINLLISTSRELRHQDAPGVAQPDE